MLLIFPLNGIIHYIKQLTCVLEFRSDTQVIDSFLQNLFITQSVLASVKKINEQLLLYGLRAYKFDFHNLF